MNHPNLIWAATSQNIKKQKEHGAVFIAILTKYHRPLDNSPPPPATLLLRRWPLRFHLAMQSAQLLPMTRRQFLQLRHHWLCWEKIGVKFSSWTEPFWKAWVEWIWIDFVYWLFQCKSRQTEISTCTQQMEIDLHQQKTTANHGWSKLI